MTAGPTHSTLERQSYALGFLDGAKSCQLAGLTRAELAKRAAILREALRILAPRYRDRSALWAQALHEAETCEPESRVELRLIAIEILIAALREACRRRLAVPPPPVVTQSSDPDHDNPSAAR